MKKKRHSARRKTPVFLTLALTCIIATSPILWGNAEALEDAPQTEAPAEETSGHTEAAAEEQPSVPEEIPAVDEGSSSTAAPPAPEEIIVPPPAADENTAPEMAVPEETVWETEGSRGETSPTEMLPPETQPSSPTETPSEPSLLPEESSTDIPAEQPAHQHDASCGYRAPQPEIPCDHQCTDTDGNGLINHCAECAFRPADPGSPCRFEQAGGETGGADIQPPTREEASESTAPGEPEETTVPPDPAVSGNDAPKTTESETGTMEETSSLEETVETDPAETETQEPSESTEDASETEPETECETETSPEAETADPPKTEAFQDGISGNGISDNSIPEELKQPESTVSGNDVSANDLTAESETHNKPTFAIAIPAKVILNESRSFPIQLLTDQPDYIGSVTVTVDGTTSPDGRFYALYCGQIWWSYQLLLEGNQLNPQQNQVMLTPQNGTQQVQILSAGDKMYAGTYNGNLRFSVSYHKEHADSQN